jgi:hypothetical protein
MAGAGAEWLKKSAIDSFAMCYAYTAIEKNRTGGGCAPGYSPVDEAYQKRSSVKSEYGAIQVCVTKRPDEKASFNLFQEMMIRLVFSTAREADVVALLDAMESDDVGRLGKGDSFLDSVDRTSSVIESIRAAAQRMQFGGDLSHLRDVSGEAVLALMENQYELLASMSACQL